MKSRNPPASFTSQEFRRFVLPLTAMGILVMAALIIDGVLSASPINVLLVSYGIAGVFYIIAYNALLVRSSPYREIYGWLSAAVGALGLSALFTILPIQIQELFHFLLIITSVAMATAYSWRHAYLILAAPFITILFTKGLETHTLNETLELFGPFLVSIVITEVVLRVKEAAQQHMRRLEAINKASHQIMSSLNTEQVLILLNAALQNAVEADSYYVGLLEKNEIHLKLFYDDGEYFTDTRVPVEGSLSSWVINNNRELFLPDLRNDVDLEGVKQIVIGKEKTSLSWIGVPMITEFVKGLMVISSYKANAFDRADLELLSSLAQQAALALDNTYRHAMVEEQTRLDSLTGVYNHGYFLKKLSEQADNVLIQKDPISLIMLDIDYFKQYNDTYGHLVGDRVLTALCESIRRHIKAGDSVGRWGGEEFIISLPGATGEQALQVAKRISQTMSTLKITNRENDTVPVPTVSQGIAVFPDEADEIYKLIDLADRRLYVAKERGRNQIEPNEKHWAKTRPLGS